MPQALFPTHVDHGLGRDRKSDPADNQPFQVLPVYETQKLRGALTVQFPAAQDREQGGLLILKQRRSGGDGFGFSFHGKPPE